MDYEKDMNNRKKILKYIFEQVRIDPECSAYSNLAGEVDVEHFLLAFQTIVYSAALQNPNMRLGVLNSQKNRLRQILVETRCLP
jgi:hypothetical protein